MAILKTSGTARIKIAPVIVLLALVATACGGDTTPVSLGKQPPAGVIVTDPDDIKALQSKAAKTVAEVKQEKAAEADAAKNAGKGVEAPPPPSPGLARESDPTAPGTYTYHVTGTAKSSTGTEKIDDDIKTTYDKAYLAERGAQRQATRGGAGGFGGAETTFLWESNQVGIEKVASQGFECRFSPPVKVRPVPLEIGITWSSEGACTGATTTIDGEVLRKETITIGKERVECFVLHVNTHTKGSGGGQTFEQKSDSMEWFSPKYRITVKQVSHNEFKGFGEDGTADTTATLKSLKPS